MSISHEPLHGPPTPFSDREDSPALKFEQFSQPSAEDYAVSEKWKRHKDYPELYDLSPDIHKWTADIADLPIVRPLILRPGRSLNFQGKGHTLLINMKSALMHQRGIIQKETCAHCLPPKPSGPYEGCIALPSFQKGACSNCVYNKAGTRCTLRKEDGIDETSKRKLSGKKKEMRIDRGPNEFIHVDDNEESRGEEEMTGVEFGTREDPTVQGSRGVSPEADPELVPYVRRPAAVEATSRLSFYTYTDKDVEVGSQSQDSQEVPNRNGHAPSISVQQQSRIPEIVAETASDYDEQFTPTERSQTTETESGALPTLDDLYNASPAPRPQSALAREDSSKNKRKTPERDHPSDDETPLPRRQKTIHVSSARIPLPTGSPPAAPAIPIVPVRSTQGYTLDEIPDTYKQTPSARRLSSMPGKRALDWRAKAGSNLNKPYNYESALGYCVGDEVKEPCQHCLNSRGGFTKCVIVPGMFSGSCASCHYNGMNSRCTFYDPITTTGRVVEPAITPASMPTSPQKNLVQQDLFVMFSGPSHPSKSMGLSAPDMNAVKPPEIVLPTRANSTRANSTSANSTPAHAGQPAAATSLDARKIVEQRRKMVYLKMQIGVLTNVMTNLSPAKKGDVYRQLEAEFKEMDPMEQELRLADLELELIDAEAT